MNKNKYFLGRADHTVHCLDPLLYYSWLNGIQLSEKTMREHLKDFKCKCLEGTHTKKITSSFKRKEATFPNHKDIARIKMFVFLHIKAWPSRQCILKKH